jgi:hypothetical protein
MFMNIRRILTTALLLGSFAGVNAQQRTCDMAINLVEPAPSAVINAFAQYHLRVNIANNGPDTLLAGDTLYYNKPSQPLFDYDLYILQAPINPGNNVTLTLETLTNINSEQTDQVADYYVFVVSNPANNGRFIDTTNDANNYDVNANVTFKAGNPTGVAETEKDKVGMQLYPNPANSELAIKLDASNKASSAKISDIAGREVMNTTFATKGDQRLNVSTLLPGLYFIQVETEQGRATTRFVKK